MVVLVYASVTEHLNHRIGWLVYPIFRSSNWYLQDQPDGTTKTQTDDNGENELGRRLRLRRRRVKDRRKGISYDELR